MPMRLFCSDPMTGSWCYLKNYEGGVATFTADSADAMQFPDIASALAFRRQWADQAARSVPKGEGVRVNVELETVRPEGWVREEWLADIARGGAAP